MEHQKKHAILSLLSISLLFLIGFSSQSNEKVNLVLADESELIIKGGSTLHSWDSEATEFSILFQVGEEWLTDIEKWSGERVDTLQVIVPVEKLESGRSRMNRDMRKALNADDHPEIKFIWDEIVVGEGSNENGKVLNVKGSLSIAGETRSVEFETLGELFDENRIKVEGSYNLNMRDYNVDPPTAFFGTLKADERVAIEFNLVLERE